MNIARELANRERNARWCREKRGCSKSQEWLAGTPPYHTHLLGGACSISLDPVPRWPIELRNTRALHGAITAILDMPHGRFPRWSLIPWQTGWAVYWLSEDGTALAMQERMAPLFDKLTRFRFGPVVRFRSPRVPRRGRQRVRVDAVTPVVITDDGRARAITCPTGEQLLGSIRGEYLRKIAPSETWEIWVRERVRAELVERHTEPAHIPMGGKYGVVHGWTGSAVLCVNATARWVLGVAERTGLGGRTAFGFGRIRVSDDAGDT